MKKAGSFKAMLAAGAMVALGALVSPAAAQRADDMRPGQGGGQHACAGDAQRICGEFIPDRGKVASCLFKNKSQLSAGCRTELGGGKKASGKKKGKRNKKKKSKR